jgi:hypothetical protein
MTPLTHNRLTAAAATGIFLILSVVLASFSTRQDTDVMLQRPSTFFTDPSGARALLLVMQKLLPSVDRWRRPLTFLPLPQEPDAPSTLIVAGPVKSISATETDRLGRWLAGGGQLILLAANGWSLGRGSATDEISSPGERRTADEKDKSKFETLLSLYAPGLRWTKAGEFKTGMGRGSSLPPGDISLRWRQSFLPTDNAEVIASVGHAILAVSIPIDRGRIVAVADPTMVSNAALRRSDNAVWLVSLAAAWGKGKILFDEYHHGFGEKRGTGELVHAFLITPWGWSVLQLSGAALLYLFVYRRRFGRVSEPLPSSRASPLELVNARAGFFQAAAAQGFAAELIVQDLYRHLTQGRRKVGEGAGLSDELASLPVGSGTPELAALRALVGRTQNGERLSDRELIELGAAAGNLVKGSRL